MALNLHHPVQENGPSDDLWRVDVEGIPMTVKGRAAKEHLERVNRKLAGMKLALHWIKTGRAVDPRHTAAAALEDVGP